MATYQIKGWTKFQHYQSGKRNPDWIKLYRGLLDDIDWHLLDPKAAKALVMLWLLASETGGILPPLPKIAFRLRLSEKETKSILSQLDHWVEQDASEVLAPCYQSDSLEEEENKKENKKEKENESGASAPLSILKTILDDEHAEAVLAYRSKRQQSNSPLALRRLANQLSQFSSPNEGAAEMICRGWSGFRAEWMAVRGTGPPAKEKHFRGTVQEFLDEVDEKHGNSRREICGQGSGGGFIELHAAAPGLENHAEPSNTGFDRAAEIDAAEDG